MQSCPERHQRENYRSEDALDVDARRFLHLRNTLFSSDSSVKIWHWIEPTLFFFNFDTSSSVGSGAYAADSSPAPRCLIPAFCRSAPVPYAVALFAILDGCGGLESQSFVCGPIVEFAGCCGGGGIVVVDDSRLG
jgi:hypothetical protein